MIYIVDDTPLEQIAQIFSPDEFSDVLRIFSDMEAGDVSCLSDGDCIMVHTSFHHPAVRKKICSNVCDFGASVPLVLFSDGDLPEAVFDNETYITQYKKSEMYARLPIFLNHYRKTGDVNLHILAEGLRASSETAPALPGTRYSLGLDERFASSVGATPLPFPEVIPKTEKEVHDLMVSLFREPVSVAVFNLDMDSSLCLNLAMHIRLSKEQLGDGHLCPIIFVSEKPLSEHLRYSQSQIALTDGVTFCNVLGIKDAISNTSPLSEESFRSAFLNRIDVKRPEGSNHSLANQWGASRLYRIVCGRKITPDEYRDFNDIQKELYYKFIINRLSKPSPGPAFAYGEKVPNAFGKKILLIDDEADKGWAKTLERIFPTSQFDASNDVICERIADYENLSSSARKKIEEGGYDLFLLDLRLNGDQEDSQTEPQKMSGYKVLHHIKSLNKGNQVIMLTASNKAWNLKALLDPLEGASGYFVKESPEYEFSDEFSIANLESFRKDAEQCFDRGYLRRFWRLIEQVKPLSSDPTIPERKRELFYEILSQMEIAFGLCAQASSEEVFQYAYLSTFQVFEVILSHYIHEEFNRETKQKELWIRDDEGNDIQCDRVVRDEARFLYRAKKGQPFRTEKDHKIFGQRDKFSSLYLQKWGQTDNGLIYLLEQLIIARNDLIHKNEITRLDGTRKLLFTNIFSYADLVNPDCIFSDEAIKTALNAACMDGLLYDNGHLLLHPDIANSYVGVSLLLECLSRTIPLI